VELFKLLALAAVFIIGLLIGADDDRAKAAIRWLLRLGLVYSLWAFYDRVSNPALLFGAPRAFDPHRLSASLASANTAATLFGLLSLLNLVDLDRTLMRRPIGRPFRLSDAEPLLAEVALPGVGFAAAVTCLLLTLSRSGLLATGALLALMIAALAVRTRRGAISTPVLATATVLAGLLLISLALNFDALRVRLAFLPGDALGRLSIFAAHWGAFMGAPLSGYGLGSFPRVNAMVMNQSNMAVLETLPAVHNVYLQWLEQAGMIGAAVMFVCIGLITLRVARGALRRRRMRSWLVGILAVILLFLIQGASDYALEVPAMAALLSLLMGLGCGISGGRGWKGP
jgi:O-antigen ligase